MKKLILITAIATLTACAGTQKTNVPNVTTTNYASDGTILSTSNTVSQRYAADIAMERTRADCFRALYTRKYPTDAASIMALALADVAKTAVNGGAIEECKGSTNSNDVSINQTNQRHGTGRAVIGGLTTALKWGGGAYVAGKLLDGIAGQGGVTVNGNGNAVEGVNSGDGASVTHTSGGGVAGAGSGDSVAFNEPTNATSTTEGQSYSDLCTAAGGNPREVLEGETAIEDGLVCSDGNGGLITL